MDFGEWGFYKFGDNYFEVVFRPTGQVWKFDNEKEATEFYESSKSGKYRFSMF